MCAYPLTKFSSMRQSTLIHSSLLLFNYGKDLQLCDFGTARKLEQTLTNAVGTIRYMAPEVIKGCGPSILHPFQLPVSYVHVCVPLS